MPADVLQMVIEELENHRILTQQEKGCLVFEVTQSKTDPTRFEVYEEFTDRVAFEMHQQRVRNSNWGEITQHVARFYDIFE
ncbi:antibiotic biosynthesis monooxygenase [Vibrio sp. PP-XX7]